LKEEILERTEWEERMGDFLLENAPAAVISDLGRQPDLADLQRDPRFLNLMPKSP